MHNDCIRQNLLLRLLRSGKFKGTHPHKLKGTHMETKERTVPGYERVVSGVEETAGYHGIVVIHSTAMGPAVGRARPSGYKKKKEANNPPPPLPPREHYKNTLSGAPFC